MRKLDQAGQGMTEYILVVALIAVAVIGAVKFFGKQTKAGFGKAGDAVSSAVQDAEKSSKETH